MTLIWLLDLLALVCFVAAAVNVPSRVSWVPLGLALWMLGLLL